MRDQTLCLFDSVELTLPAPMHSGTLVRLSATIFHYVIAPGLTYHHCANLIHFSLVQGEYLPAHAFTATKSLYY